MAFLVSGCGQIFHLEGQMVFVGRELPRVSSRFGESGLSFPPYIYILGGVVNLVLDFCMIGVLNDDAALVTVGL